MPHGYNLLFFNDSCHVGINVKDENVKHVICETVDQSAIIQAIGRVRHDLDKITVITNNKNKKPFFKNLERAREFFTDEKIDLYTWNKLEQQAIKEAQGKSLGFDILTYKDQEGAIKVNPFAKACYEYLFDIYRKLDKPWTAKEYFDDMLRPLCISGNVLYVSADEIKKRATNNSRFNPGVIAAYLNRDLFKADRNQLSELLGLVDSQRRVRG